MRYDSKLDTLRACAALAVLAYHSSAWVGWGWMGVPLFFVLSGYLITSILLESKRSRPGLPRFAGTFFVRRCLRLLPVYLLFLTAVGLADLLRPPGQLHHDIAYLLTYTFNFRLLDHVVRSYGHLWSLSVEWQFYLLWPFAVWLLSEWALKRLLVVVVGAAPVLRYATLRWFTAHGVHYEVAADNLYLLTWTHLDTLGLGALLAWRTPREFLGRRAVVIGAAATLLASGALVTVLGWRDGFWGARNAPGLLQSAVGMMGFREGLSEFHEYVWGYSLMAVFFAAVVAAASRASVARGVFRWNWLTYLGRISYGFYVFHVAALYLVQWLLRLAGIDAPANPWGPASLLLFLLAGTVAFLLAHLSYQLWESPFLRLQHRMTAHGTAPVPRGVIAA